MDQYTSASLIATGVKVVFSLILSYIF